MSIKISTIDTIFFKVYFLTVKTSNDRLLSVAEAAELLGVSRWRVNQFIKENRLPAEKIGRSYVLKESNLEAVKERKTGRPPKAKGEK